MSGPSTKNGSAVNSKAAVPAASSGQGKSWRKLPPLVDIGANMLDPMFQGEYREKPRHPPDLPAVLSRALDAGVAKVMVTAGSLQESREAAELCRRARGPEGSGWPELYCTVGVHPTRCSEFEEFATGPEAYLKELVDAAHAAGEFCVAAGECGLDYDRLQFCPREVQLKYFEWQLTGIVAPLGLPLFLHCRTGEAATDLLALLSKHRASLPSSPGVVHSFDGSLEDAQGFIDMGFYIGINGCSLKTQDNLDVVKQLPEERILLETDAPWCGIKASHAGHGFVKSTWDEVKKPEKWEEGRCVKDRCEPCQLRQVLEVVAGCRGTDPEVSAGVVHRTNQAVSFAKGKSS
eukprot:TRINITY_DN75982_c0_g1_i1.p1 TRINITY_DN75982_c0_g1~~TRINITY_DN75982_c0_g1_i1.p1  ORF type:complete len:407 (+),score=86.53 TRINITY_DN75982_c0_g1_i1:179-1222(+)